MKTGIPLNPLFAVFSLLALHLVLLTWSAYVHSPTLNEPGHLASGLAHWKFGRFEMYRVNPPLVRMVAALPVMAAGHKVDWSGFHERPGARVEFKVGEDFLAANGERSFFLLNIARWACIPFSLLGAIVCYLWARDLYGRAAGVLACTIWCFEPNILGHASLMTPDAHAAALGLAACYTFWRWLRRPTWAQAAFTGAVLGLSELTKTTLILFYPLWPAMWLAYRWADRRSMSKRAWLRESGMLAVRMVVGLYVLNLGYGFEGSFQQLKKFHFISDLFTGKQQLVLPTEAASSGRRDIDAPLAADANNRFCKSWLGGLPVPFPKNYLLGMDVQRKDFEHYSRKSYLRGNWSDRGWWYYYLYAVVIKVPIGLWLLGAVVIVSRLADCISRKRRFVDAQAAPRSPLFRDEMFLLLPAIVIFAVVSSQTGFNEHTRYVLPSFPYFFVWLGQAPTFWRPPDWFSRGLAGPSWRRRIGPVWSALPPLFLAWFLASSLWIYPHSLSYFNELVGGPLNGPNHLLGSNVDWCQDLLYLKWWTEKHPEVKELHLAYHGYFDPNIANLFGVRLLSVEEAGSLKSKEDATPAKPATATSAHAGRLGWYAISVNVLYGTSPGHCIGTKTSRLDADLAKQLRATPPTDRAGYSILIFHL
ncbi:MAG: glycosyltransferase family 39 protein [Pirellulales bacterium]